LVDTAESDSATTIICGREPLVRQIFHISKTRYFSAENHGFLSLPYKRAMKILFLQKKESRQKPAASRLRARDISAVHTSRTALPCNAGHCIVIN